MGVNLSALETHLPNAIRHFWNARLAAAESQRRRGIADQGNRAGVTAGKNMDGFIRLLHRLIIDNGMADSDVLTVGFDSLTLPGFYRPTKRWDLLVVWRNQLVAAIEVKSQVGPSFGNNFNNRVEEALGNAVDLNTAFREGAFGDLPKPFVGYLFVLEDCKGSTTPVKFNSPHFPAFPEFTDTSYANRYEILCRKLVQEQLYDAAALVLTQKQSAETGAFKTASNLTSPQVFAAELGAKIAGRVAGNR